MNHPSEIRLLFVDEDIKHYQLISQLIRDLTSFQLNLTWIATENSLSAAITSQSYDVYLLSSPALINILEPQVNYAPILVLTDDIQQGQEALRAGASDYLELEAITASDFERSLRLTLAHATTKRQCQNCGLTETLLQSEVRYQRLYEQTPAILYSIDCNGIILSASNRYLEILGYERSEVIGHPCVQFLTEECRNHALNFGLPRFFRDGYVDNLPYQFVKKNGEIIDMLLSAISETDESGNFIRSLAVLEDITQRKQVEAQLTQLNQDLETKIQERTREIEEINHQLTQEIYYRQEIAENLQQSQEKLQYVIHNAPIILYALDPNGIITFVDGESLSQIEIAAEAMIGKSVFEIFSQDSELLNQFRLLLTGDFDQKVWYGNYGGRIFENRNISLKDSHNQTIGIIGVATDVTDLRRTEDQLKRKNEDIEAIFAAFPDLFFRINSQGIITDYKAQIDQLDDLSSQFLGKSVREALPQTAVIPIETAIEEALATNSLVSTEYNLSIHEKTRFYEARIVPLANQEVIGIIRDITQRYQAELALKDSERLYRTTLANVSDAILITDNQGNFTFICPNISVIFGYSPDEINHLTNIEQLLGNQIFNPEELELNGEIFNIERKITDKFGNEHSLLVTVKKVTIGQGRILYSCHDITERKQIELKLRESESRLAKAQEIAHIGNWEWDIATDKLLGSDEIYRIFGYQPQDREITQEIFLSCIHPDDLPLVQASLEATLNCNQLEGVDYRIILPNGEIKMVSEQSELVCNESNEVIKIVGTIQDITDRKQAEIKIKESEARLAKAQEIANLGNWEWDFIANRVFWSDQAYRIFGFQPQEFEITEEIFLNCVHPEDRPLLEGVLHNVLSRGQVCSLEYRIVLPDATLKTVHEQLEVIYNDHNQPIKLIGTVQDITDRKEFEQKLIESENRYRNLLDNSPAIIYAFSLNQGGIFYSSQVETILGYAPSYLLEHPLLWYDSIHPEDRIKVDQAVEKYHQGHHFEVEYRILNAQGNWCWFYDRSFGRRVEHDDIIIEGIVIDITERKQFEAILTKEKNELTESQKIAHLGNWDWRIDSDQISCSDEVYRIFGLNKREFGTNYEAFLTSIHPQDRELVTLAVNEALTEGQPYNIDYRIVLPNSEVRTVHAQGNVTFNPDGKPIRMIGTIQDITERKQIELALKASELRFQTIFNQAAIGIAQIALTGEFSLVNQKFVDIVGYSLDELQEMTWQDLTYADDISLCIPQFEQMLAGALDKLTIEKRYLHKDGHLIWIQATASLIHNEEGQPEYLLGLIEDITQQKQSAVKLRESEQRYLNLAESVPVGIFRANNQGYCLYINHKTVQISGISKEEALGSGWLNSVHPDDRQRLSQEWQAAVTNGDIFNIEHRFLRPDGLVTWVIAYAIPEYDSSGQITSYIGSLTDITERKKTEEKLIISEARLAEAQKVAHIGSWEYDIRTQDMIWSEELFKLYGYEPSASVPSFAERLQRIHPDDRDLILPMFERAITEGKPYQIDYRIILPDGKMRYTEVRGEIVRNQGGEPIKIFGTVLDITERKQIQLELEKNQAQLQAILDYAPILISIKDLEGNIVVANRQFELLDIPPLDEFLGKNLFEVFPPEIAAKLWDNELQALNAREARQFEEELVHKDGNIHTYLTTKFPVFTEATTPFGICAISADITERKLIEAELRDSKQFIEAIADTIPQLLYIYDLTTGGNVYLNRQSSEILGYTPEAVQEAGARFFLDNIHPDDLHLLENFSQNCAQLVNSQVFESEFRLKHCQGAWRWFKVRNVIFKRNVDGTPQQVLGTALDITEQKQAEIELKDNKNFIQHVLDANPTLIYIYNVIEQRNIYLNGDFLPILGYSPQEIQSMGNQVFPLLIHPEDLPQIIAKQSLFNDLQDQKVIELEYRMRHKDGAWRWLYSRDTIFSRTADGKAQEVLGVALDITSKKQAEEALQESEHRFRLIIEQTGQIIYDYNIESGNIQWDGAIEQITGFTVAEFSKVNITQWVQMLHPEDRESSVQDLNDCIHNLTDYNIQYRFLHQNGDYIYIEDRAVVLSNSEGQAYRMLGVLNDITAKKQAELALKASEQQLRLITDALPVCISYIDREQRYRFVNKTYQTWFGYQPETLYGKTVLELIGASGYAQVREYVELALSGQNVNYEAEIPYAPGGSRYVMGNLIPHIADDQVQGYYALISDISDRKRYEEQLQASEQRFRTLFENAGVVTIVLCPEHRIIEWNEEAEVVFGYQREEVIGEDYFLLFLPPEDHHRSAATINKTLAGENIRNYENVIITRNGQEKWLIWNLDRLIDIEGHITGIIACGQDITQRKQIETNLRESEQRFRAAFEQAAVAMAHLTPDGHFFLVNEKLCDFLGYSESELLNRNFQSVTYPEDIEASLEPIKRILLGQSDNFTLEKRYLHKNGTIRWGKLFVVLIRHRDGSPKYFMAIIEDIQERKQAEIALINSEQRFRAAFEQAAVGMVHTAPNGTLLLVNQALCDFLGYSQSELLTTDFQSLTYPDDINISLDYLQRLLAREDVNYSFEKRYIRKNGDIVWAKVFSSVIRNQDDSPKYLMTIIEDIQARKHAEIALMESEARFRAAFEQASVGIAQVAVSGQFLQVNQRFCDLVGYSESELLTDNFQELTHPDDLKMNLDYVRRTLAGEISNYQFEKRYVRKDGDIQWVDLSSSLVRDINGQPQYFVAVVANIQERKEAEEALKASEARYRAIVEDQTELLYRFLPDGTITFVNEAYCHYFGKTKEELLGHGFMPVIPEEDTELSEVNLRICQTLTPEEPTVILEQRVVIDGEIRHQQWTNHALFDENGHIIEIQGLGQDVTARKQAETQLQYRLIIETAVAEVSQQLATRENVNFKDILGILGIVIGASRVYLTLYRDNTTKADMAYEWTDGMVTSLLSHFQDVSMSHFPWWMAMMHSNQNIIVNDLESLPPEAETEKQQIQSGGVNSMIAVPLYTSYGELWGVMGFDTSGHKYKQWSNEDAQILRVVGEMIYSYCDRQLFKTKLEYRLQLETTLAQVARELATNESADINNLLGLLGGSVGVDHVYLSHFRNYGRLVDHIHQWWSEEQCYSEIPLSTLETTTFPWWSEQLNNNRDIVINNVALMPANAQYEREFLELLGVCSAIVVPIYNHSGQLWGQIGFENRESNYKQWSDEDIQLLRLVGSMFYSHYARSSIVEQLRASEALYAGVFNHSAEAIFLVNVGADNQFIYETMNPTYSQLSGLYPADFVGKMPTEVFSATTATKIIESYQYCLTIKETFLYEETLELPVGTRIWRTNLVPLTDSQGNIVKLQGSSRDITEEEQLERERKRQLRYQELLASLTLKIRQSWQISEVLEIAVQEIKQTFQVQRTVIIRCHPDGTGEIVKQAVNGNSPLVLQEIVGEQCTYVQCQQKYLCSTYIDICQDIRAANYDPCYLKLLEHYQIRAQIVLPIVVSKAISESEINQIASTKPANAETVIWGLLCVQQCDQPRAWSEDEVNLLRQLTDQLSIALYQAELRKKQWEQRQELARSNAELQQFAYVASHDLQEPLNTISSYAKLLERRYQDQLDAKANKYIYYIVDGAKRMQQQINDLLEYSRVNTRQQPLRETDCNDVVQRAIANLQASIRKQQATVTIKGELPLIMADQSQLLQLFQNLIGNAIKYRGEAAPLVEISVTQQEDHWLFAIKDNGIGIEPQYQGRIFQIFQRLHTMEEYPGTGIGLAICQRIVEKHGGKIWVESELGEGSTFYFSWAK